MFLPAITEVRLFGAVDQGIPNRERIVIYVEVPINLQNFLLGAGFAADNQLVTPFPNVVYFFDDIEVAAKTWVVIYTGPGQKKVSKIPPNDEVALIYHWGCSSVLFHQKGVIPILFRIAEMGFEKIYPSALQTLIANAEQRRLLEQSEGSAK